MEMMATDTVHPPADSKPIIIFLSQPGLNFLILPTALGVYALQETSFLHGRAMRLMKRGDEPNPSVLMTLFREPVVQVRIVERLPMA